MLTGCDNGQGFEIVVSNTEDSGEGTLRWTLEMAEAGDTIIFDPAIFSPDDPTIINIQSKLPGLDQGNVTIDASNAGVILDGSKIDDGFCSGLSIHSDNNTIQGLWFHGFAPGAGIEITGSNNLIGGDPSIGSGLTGLASWSVTAILG